MYAHSTTRVGNASSTESSESRRSSAPFGLFSFADLGARNRRRVTAAPGVDAPADGRSRPRAASLCCARVSIARVARRTLGVDSLPAKASKSSDAAAVASDRPRWRYVDATASVVPPSRLNESHARRIESAAASGEGAGARGDDASSSPSSSSSSFARGRAPAARRRATVRRRSRKDDRFAEAASIFRRCASASSDWCLARFTAALRTRSDAALALTRVRSSASSCEEWVRGVRGEREESVAKSRQMFSGRPRQSFGFLGFGNSRNVLSRDRFLPVLTGT